MEEKKSFLFQGSMFKKKNSIDRYLQKVELLIVNKLKSSIIVNKSELKIKLYINLNIFDI